MASPVIDRRTLALKVLWQLLRLSGALYSHHLMARFSMLLERAAEVHGEGTGAVAPAHVPGMTPLLWLLQAGVSNVPDFDFMAYALQRLDQYSQLRASVLS